MPSFVLLLTIGLDIIEIEKRVIKLSERYIKRTQKGKGKTLKEQNKRIKELISKSTTHNLIDKIIVNVLVDIFTDKEKESKARGD